jgi:hypothetical protein
MITDLKKENFDLKLRLYHIEDMLTKDLDLYQLNEEVISKFYITAINYYLTNDNNRIVD